MHANGSLRSDSLTGMDACGATNVGRRPRGCSASASSASSAVNAAGRTLTSRGALIIATIAAAACAPARTTQPAPGAGLPDTTGAPVANALPPVPAHDGPLAIDVVYPDSGQTVATDSTFVFGSVGSGRARLTINGTSIDVAPNGAFLAFLPVPRDGIYRLEATKDGTSASAERRIAVPQPALPPAGVTIVPGSTGPAGAWAVPADQAVEVGFRGTRGGRATLVLPGGERVPLHEVPGVRDPGDISFVAEPGARVQQPAPWSRYEGVLLPRPLAVADTAVGRPALGAAALVPDSVPAVFELVVGADTARTPLALNLTVLDPRVPHVGVVTAPIDAGPDWEARGRAHTSGPFHWFWPHGTRLQIVEQRNGMLRARLTETLSAWVPAGDVRLLPPGTPAPFSTIAGVRMVHRADAIDVHVPMAEPLPFRIDEDGSTLQIDVYGAKSTSNFFQYGRLDPLVERAGWSQPDDDIYRITLHLAQPVWGYQAFRAANGDLVVRVRRPPVIDPAHPLRGLRIAVDAGHPPAGATGPTRLTEADANLAIARALRPMLERAGAHVIMIRDDTGAVALGDRPRMAADSNAHVLVSIHNNAFPDGVNPFENNGTSVYYFQPHSAGLAQHLQRELLAELRLRDIGIGRADLALVRPTWMPAVLTETMFLMVPQQEAALRDPEVHRRIAAAHLRALEAFLRERAAAGPER